MINVTKTYFPDIKEYINQIERIWDNQWLTNRGELLIELEQKIKEYLNIDYVLITNSAQSLYKLL